MKLRTSYCNGTVIKKNLTRYAPVWVLYTVFWLLIMVMILVAGGGAGVGFASDMSMTLSLTAILNFCYALLCGQLLFGDLYNSRMCNSLHALPLRREGWFITNVLCGLLFSLVPNLFITLISTLFMGEAWVVAPLWLLGMTLQYLFFFGVAVLSAYCVGNRFAMALVYCIIHFFSLIAYALIESLYTPMLYGIRVDTEVFRVFSPVYYMLQENLIEVEYYGRVGGKYINLDVQMLSGWWYLAICAGVGLVFMGIGLLLYRRRSLESAGDFVAVKALGPVFMLLYCLCGGAAGYLFFSLFVGEESLFFLIVGMTVGWFTGRMLLERTVRVFRGKNLIGYGAFILVFLLSLGLTRLDLMGITRWVPQADQVKSVRISTDSLYYYNASDYAMTDARAIEDILTIHRYGIENRDADYNGVADVDLSISYQLKDGRTVNRYYTVDMDTRESGILESYMSRKEYVLGPEATDATAYAAQLVQIEAEGHLIYGEEKEALIRAILLDCEAGTMAQDWSFHQDEEVAIWLSIQFKRDGNANYYRDIRVYPSNENTVAWLEANGIHSAKYEDYTVVE